MPASNKVGTQLLVSPHLRDRARALAIVRRESVAEVWRAALEGAGLAGLERQHAADLSTLHASLNYLTNTGHTGWTLENMYHERGQMETLKSEVRAVEKSAQDHSGAVV